MAAPSRSWGAIACVSRNGPRGIDHPGAFQVPGSDPLERSRLEDTGAVNHAVEEDALTRQRPGSPVDLLAVGKIGLHEAVVLWRLELGESCYQALMASPHHDDPGALISKGTDHGETDA